MTKKKKNIDTKEMLSKIVVLIFSGIVGAVGGSMIYAKNMSPQDTFLELFLILAIFIISYTVQIILHESGHLIFGLLSGYEFTSFRIGNLTIIKEDGKLAIKKFNLKGTAGQCIMFPKEDDYEKCSYVLYNLGGVLMNAIVSALCFVVYTIASGNTNIDSILICMIGSGIVIVITNGIPMKISGVVNDGYNVMSIINNKIMKYGIDSILICMIGSGIVIVITNGIPMKISGVVNDGYNVMSIINNKIMKYGFYIQLKVNGLMSRGMRVKDMPLKWFQIDEKSDFSNPLVTSIKCIEANYYHDKLEFDKAKECYEFLLNYNPKIIKLYEYEIKCELLFYEIIGERNEEKISKLYTDQLKSYIKASKSHISKMRLMYAYALIIEKDMQKANNILDKIEINKNKYPNKGETESELEIIKFVRDNFKISTTME